VKQADENPSPILTKAPVPVHGEGARLFSPVNGGVRGGSTVNAQTLEKWLGYLLTTRIEKQWKSLTGTGIKTYGDELQIGGIELGNIWIGVQPPLGISGDPMRLMFERDMTPHPQYAAFYKWLQNDFKLMLWFTLECTVL
jgi:magnesium chelatase subunit H